MKYLLSQFEKAIICYFYRELDAVQHSAPDIYILVKDYAILLRPKLRANLLAKQILLMNFLFRTAWPIHILMKSWPFHILIKLT